MTYAPRRVPCFIPAGTCGKYIPGIYLHPVWYCCCCNSPTFFRCCGRSPSPLLLAWFFSRRNYFAYIHVSRAQYVCSTVHILLEFSGWTRHFSTIETLSHTRYFLFFTVQLNSDRGCRCRPFPPPVRVPSFLWRVYRVRLSHSSSICIANSRSRTFADGA